MKKTELRRGFVDLEPAPLSPSEVPIPPVELRRLVCHDDRLFDLDSSRYAIDGISPELFDSVLDFGCGCGRVARQLLVQPKPPTVYVGLDINRRMVSWCQASLQPLRSGFEFKHHDVYNKNLGPDNSPRRTQPFGVDTGRFSLVVAHSVFTHLSVDQAIFYLHEIRRALRPGGVAKTTWFLFARGTFPMLAPEQVCLFVNEDDPSNAVIYDWAWLRQSVTDAGFRIRRVVPPTPAGHQWEIHLEARQDESADVLPSAEQLRHGLCAAPAGARELQSLPCAASIGARPEATEEPPPVEAEEVRALMPGGESSSRIQLRYTGDLDKDGFEVACSEIDWWYHSYYFDNGFEVQGDYDIGADVDGYDFPKEMSGWKVLDIGSGAGWFSHYFEQRGAEVTAVDARGYEDFDVYGRPEYPPVDRPADRFDERDRPVHYSPVSRAFWIMKEILGSNVAFLNGCVYDVPQLVDGDRFDLVFLGALLCHLRDPIGALMAARRVCRRMVIASTPVVIGEPESEVEPRQYLPYTAKDRISWWLPNEACFRHWFLAAGFRDADAGPEVRLRQDKPRYSAEGKLYNGDQLLRVGRAYV